jgi:hypothetical protein
VQPTLTRVDRRIAREAKRAKQVAKRDQRREARRERPTGQGAPIDWSLSTTGQFPNAFPAVDGDPIHEGIGRTLSRGLP